MSVAEIEKCTDPFYTSKSESGGMGVGLAIVQAIADRTGGQLHFESSPGAGTTARYVFAQGGEG
jgi:signal transduction histidine kinase